MKREVLKILKENGKLDFYTNSRYYQVVEVMKYGMKQDAWLKNYLSLDPLNKAQWVADHIISLVIKGAILK